MDEDDVKEIIKMTVNETIISTIEAVQSIVNTYVNAIEDGWQASSQEQKTLSKQSVEFLVGTLSSLNEIIGELAPKRARGESNGSADR